MARGDEADRLKKDQNFKRDSALSTISILVIGS